jgi:hypothetical protein
MMTKQRPLVADGARFLLIALAVASLTAAVATIGRRAGGQGVTSGAGDTPAQEPWAPSVAAADAALARRHAGAAMRARHDAYSAALASRRWEGMVAVGDLTLRIGDASRTRPSAAAQARQAYLMALFRARAEGSVEGVMRTAEAFAGLGDREVAEHSVAIARTLRGEPGLVTSPMRLGELVRRVGDVSPETP